MRLRTRGILFALCGLALSAALVSGQSPADLTWPGPDEHDEEAESLSDSVDYTPTLGEPIEPSAGSCVTANTAGSVDAGRAEAWEFMVNQGGAYDQYGYKCNTADYTETRRQMGVLRRLLNKIFVYVGAQTSNATSPSWINPGPYAAPEAASLKFWAALEPFGTFTDPRWLLYIHHSKRRDTLIFQGYPAIVTSGGYREQGLSVCLGAAVGTYKVRWLDPKNAVDAAGNYTPLRTDTLNWPGATSCTPGGAGSVALQQSPAYNYDLAVLITL